MPLIDVFLAELEHESGTTRRLLERVPVERFDFQPHPKSMSLGRLAGHIAELTAWAANALDRDELVMAVGDAAARAPFVPASRDELLARFDDGVATFRAKAQGVSDERLREPFRMLRGDVVFLDLPRRAFLRTVLLNHVVHHRGQLSVYLRLLDVPVPSIYGPSADEERAA